MESTTGLHLKYRPQTFAEMFGQEATVASLERSLSSSTRTPAYLFHGPAGCGKTTLARLVASHRGGDVLEVDAATHSGIDAMRDVTEALQYAPLASGHRTIIVDEAHGLSAAAWQSLLKSVEEPPSFVTWCFCTTVVGKVPDTIRSRCVEYEVHKLGPNTLYDLLCSVYATERGEDLVGEAESVLWLVANQSDGSPRRALTNLAKVIHTITTDEAKELLSNADADAEGIELAKMLLAGSLTWAKAMEVVTKVKGKESADSVRLGICGYFAAVLRKTKDGDRACAVLQLLEPFADPFPYGGDYPLIRALGRALYGSKE